MTWNWAKRRHPQRARRWVKERYYTRKEGYDWVFTDGSVDLVRMLSIPIRRHVLIRGASDPYDPAQERYFAARRARHRQEAPASAPEWLFCDTPPPGPR
jgi:RNA-directed DNA polymerase